MSRVSVTRQRIFLIVYVISQRCVNKTGYIFSSDIVPIDIFGIKMKSRNTRIRVGSDYFKFCHSHISPSILYFNLRSRSEQSNRSDGRGQPFVLPLSLQVRHEIPLYFDLSSSGILFHSFINVSRASSFTLSSESIVIKNSPFAICAATFVAMCFPLLV